MQFASDIWQSCNSLVGGNGTHANWVDVIYARIDKEGQMGYFTASTVPPKTVDNGNPTISKLLFQEELTSICNREKDNIKAVKRGTQAQFEAAREQAETAPGEVLLCRVDEMTTSNAVYFWGEGISTDSITVYWWSSAEKVYLHQNCSGLFDGYRGLTELETADWDSSQVTSFEKAFYTCTGLTSIDLRTWDLSSVESMEDMFAWCIKLTSVKFNSTNVSKITSLKSAFKSCYALETIEGIGDWFTGNVVSLEDTFYQCYALQELDISEWKPEKLTDLTAMFSDCSSLTVLDVSIRRLHWQRPQNQRRHCHQIPGGQELDRFSSASASADARTRVRLAEGDKNRRG